MAVAAADEHQEARIARLESDVGHIRSDVADIKLDLRALRGRVDELGEKHTDRLATMDGRLCARVDALEARVTTRMDTVEARLNDRMDALDTKLSGQMGALDANLSGQMNALDTKLGGQIASLDSRFSGRMGALQRDLAAAKFWGAAPLHRACGRRLRHAGAHDGLDLTCARRVAGRAVLRKNGGRGRDHVLRTIPLCISLFTVITACSQRESDVMSHPDLSGLYRPAGLEVQPCGRNEWMRRSFETDTFCNGDDSAFPFTEAGRERWKSYNVIDDPVLGCVEDFPRNAMRGRPMKLTIGDEITEIAYWFNNEWFVRTVHMNGAPPPPDTPSTVTGYSVGRWSGDTLIVETTHTRGGPMYNDHKPNSASAKFTERFWRAPDGANLLMDMAIDDPETYSKPFLLNRQEWLAAPPDYQLSQDSCEPSSIWERRMRAKQAGQ